MATNFELNGELFDLTPSPKRGLPLGAKLNGTIEGDDTQQTFTPAGIASIFYMPMIGVSRNGQSALNLACQRIYKQIQAAMKNRNLPYQRTDVMVNIVCNDSIHMVYEDVKRAYKATATTNKLNRYYTEPLLKALGYDYDSFVSNRADIRTYLIKWKRILDMYPLPNVINFVGLHTEINSNVYVDTVSDQAQMYILVPRRVFTYENVDTGAGKGLEYVDFHGDVPLTWNDVKDFMETLILAMTNSTDFDIISSAILSTFESSLVVEATIPGEEEELIPESNVYFDNALMNSVLIGDFNNMGGVNLAPTDDGNNNLISQQVTTVPITLPQYAEYMNALTDNPTSIEMANYMRWHPKLRFNSTDRSYYIQECGTELLLKMTIYSTFDILYNGTVDTQAKAIDISSSCFVNGTTTSNMRAGVIKLAAVSAFKNHPILLWGIRNASNDGDINLPITQWNYIAEVPDVTPYHEAILWHSFMDKSNPTISNPETSGEEKPKKEAKK